MARTSRKGGARRVAAAPAERIWNAAVYARLSLEDSGRKGADTIETQIGLVTAYVTQRPYLSLFDTYIDNGQSGKDFDRPAWRRLMDDIRAGRVDCVCVKDLSRFGRNYVETCEFLEKIFPFMGVRFISVNDGYDSNTPGSHNEGLILALKNLMNDRHIKDISRKVSLSRKAQRERGEYTGAFAPFGYKKMEGRKGRLEPDTETATIVRDIFRWRAGGMGQAAICRLLDEAGVLPPAGRLQEKHDVYGGDYYKASVWQPKAIKRMIQSRVYLGHLAQGKTRQALYDNMGLESVPESDWHITENTHEPIIDSELWEAANAVAAARRKEYFESRPCRELPDNLFRGFLVCGACRSKLVRRYNKKTNPSGKTYEYYYYLCPLNHQHPKDSFQMVRFERIYSVAYQLVSRELQSAAGLGAIIEKRAARHSNPRAAIDAGISRAAHEIETLNGKAVRIYEDYVGKLLTEQEYVRIKTEYSRRIERHRQRMEELSRRATLMAEASASDNRWLAAARAFQNPVELTREMLEALVERIVVSGADNITVEWKFRDEFALLEACAGEEVCWYES